MIGAVPLETPGQIVMAGGVIFLAAAAAMVLGLQPARALIASQERKYQAVLQSKLLLDIQPRSVTVFIGVLMALLGLAGYLRLGAEVGAAVGMAAGAMIPWWMIVYLRRRRLRKLEAQLVDAIQTLTSGVRAGLNLVQAMQLIARDAPNPVRQEFTHLIREYEYGVPIGEALDKAAERIGSGDYHLLFSALRTHLDRGGDLGETLDRIAASIREIQRLENRVQALTAQGRATARWLAFLPMVVLGMMYWLVDPEGVRMMFMDDLGKLIVLAVLVLNVLGYLWIRWVVAIDI